MKRGRREPVLNRKRLKMFNGIGKGDFLSVFRIRIQIQSGKAKMTHKKERKKVRKFHALKCGSLEVLHFMEVFLKINIQYFSINKI
jgi:hypothetical protein